MTHRNRCAPPYSVASQLFSRLFSPRHSLFSNFLPCIARCYATRCVRDVKVNHLEQFLGRDHVWHDAQRLQTLSEPITTWNSWFSVVVPHVLPVLTEKAEVFNGKIRKPTFLARLVSQLGEIIACRCAIALDFTLLPLKRFEIAQNYIASVIQQILFIIPIRLLTIGSCNILSF